MYIVDCKSQSLRLRSRCALNSHYLGMPQAYHARAHLGHTYSPLHQHIPAYLAPDRRAECTLRALRSSRRGRHGHIPGRQHGTSMVLQAATTTVVESITLAKVLYCSSGCT